MPIKTILLPIRESDMSEHMLESGLQAALTYSAHVDALYVHPRSDDLLPFATLGMTSAIKEQIRSSAREASRAQAERLRALFDGVRERLGVPYAERGERVGTATACWVEARGVRSTEVARRGRLADLMFIPRPERASPPPKTFEAMLRDTGRPVIMIPRGASLGAVNGPVVVGWNGSTEATRAVAASRPVFRQAESVTVLVSTKRNRQQPDAAAVVTYLKCHGVNARAEVVDLSDGHVGEHIVHHCERLDAQLLVVGSYSRTRVEEMFLGGVTRYLIREAPLPVLMVH
jgi:nucleotide-binding universal stress UspA family protein